MKRPHKWRKARDRGSIILGSAIGVGVALFMGLAALFSLGVVRDLEDLRSASSDNLQWMLSQVEIENLAFVNSMENRQEDQTVDLEQVREKFDILFSRVDTLKNSHMFEGLVQDPAFEASLNRLDDFIVSALPAMDGTDKNLRANLSELRKSANEIRWDVRALSVSGLSHFAEKSDQRRKEMAQTLFRLVIVTAILFVVLAALSFYLMLINRKTQMRGRLLTQANQRMETVLSTSLDAVIVANSQGQILEFNQAAEGIFQTTFEEVNGKPIEEVIIPPELREAHRAGMMRINSGGERNVVGKGRFRLQGIRADGEVFPVELALQSAFQGREEIFIGFLRDISQLVASEEELIEARNRALAGEQAKADFLTVMSHEIRTPLNGILGNLSLLENTPLTPAQMQNVRNMEISGRVLMGHVDSVLDLATYAAGKLRITYAPVGMSEFLQELVDGQSGNAAARGNVIDWQWIGPPQHWVLTDRKSLSQILLNLIGNAIKFTQRGRVSIEAEVINGTRDISQETLTVELRVSDTGIGFPEADVEKIFEDFQTTDASFGRTSGGTGLGLGIARRLAQAMGGEIGAESTPGAGSTFWVRLPMTPIEAPALDAIDFEHGEDQPTLDILVVEDNEINLQVICAMLERDGHNVTFATDGRSGVEKSDLRRFDYVFMDISMPDMDGLQATKLIREGNGQSANSPVIAVTAQVLPQDKERFLEAGMDGVIEKPLTLENLRRTVNSLATHGEDSPAVLEGVQFVTSQLDDLRETLGERALQNLIERFVAEGDDLIKRLNKTTRSAEAHSDLADSLHKIAGSAAVFGAETFRQSLLELEIAAKAGDHSTVGALAAHLANTWSATRVALLR